jgi:hypothetical protein
VRQDYRDTVNAQIAKSATLGGPSQSGLKRAVSVKLTKKEKNEVYRPNKMAQKKDQAGLLVYDPLDIDRLRKKKINEEYKRQDEERRANGNSAGNKVKTKDKAFKVMLAEKAIKKERVSKKNADDGVAGDFVMKMPGVLGSVAAAAAKKDKGDVVVNVTGKRRLSVMLVTGKPFHYYLLNWICGLGISLAIGLIIYFQVVKRVDEEHAKADSECVYDC